MVTAAVSLPENLVQLFFGGILSDDLASEEELQRRRERLSNIPTLLLEGLLRNQQLTVAQRQEVKETDSREKAEAQIILNHLAQTLEEHIAAIKRYVVGTWGVCTVCGENIDIQRLFVKPTCARCFTCSK